MALSVSTYTKTGSKASDSIKLDATIFGIKKFSPVLIKQAYLSYLARGRQMSASTITRGDIRGGGRKPWRQKGTGRARHGSIRSPIWRGGGIVFGPSGKENYQIKLSKKSKKVAVTQALSLAQGDDKIKVIQEFAPKSAKTKEAYNLLMKLDAEKNVLIVVDKKTPESTRATSNLKRVKLVSATYLNVYDVLNADTIIIEEAALESLKSWLAGGENE